MPKVSRIPRQRGHGPLEAWLRRAMVLLAEVSDTPRLDAELLAAHALGMSREDMVLRMPDLAPPAGIDALLDRRIAREPMAQITGTRDFWTLTLKVTPDVLVPRPDSETLIEAAIEHFGEERAPRTILDLGTGSGALLLAALDTWSGAHGLGVDISQAALAVARENARSNGLEDRATFQPGDWFAGLNGQFDLILCNPPYIRDDAILPPDVVKHEPALALFGGPDGLDAYRVLAAQLAPYMAPGGVALFEIGFDQATSVGDLFRGAFLNVGIARDLAGLDRCLVVTGP